MICYLLRKGYRVESIIDYHERNLENIVTFETEELGNEDIFCTIKKLYDLDCNKDELISILSKEFDCKTDELCGVWLCNPDKWWNIYHLT